MFWSVLFWCSVSWTRDINYLDMDDHFCDRPGLKQSPLELRRGFLSNIIPLRLRELVTKLLARVLEERQAC